mgnify:CR=1 FL=1
MNASSWSLRNLPWFKATLAQWRYALRNTIAMCLALTVAYYLNLDEPYWAMTSAAGTAAECVALRRDNRWLRK